MTMGMNDAMTARADGAVTEQPSESPVEPRTPQMLSHLAYVTKDAKATEEFYTNVLKMDFVNGVMDDSVPSTGDDFPYFHIFFRLGDGSTIAFFEAPGLPDRDAPPHPAYRIFDHLALEVSSPQEVDAWKVRLEEHGLDVVGPTDHGIIYSIYFRDPVNDIRLELTAPLKSDWNDRGPAAAEAMKVWVQTKDEAKARSADPAAALTELIKAKHRILPTDPMLNTDLL
jgi:catechol 2,3-dioxygenase-like lactoylglutathione lyase family enzyme